MGGEGERERVKGRGLKKKSTWRGGGGTDGRRLSALQVRTSGADGGRGTGLAHACSLCACVGQWFAMATPATLYRQRRTRTHSEKQGKS